MTGLPGEIPTCRLLGGLLFAAMLLAVDVGVAPGQEATTLRREGWIVGPLVGVPGVGSDYEVSLFTVGLGVTRLVPNRPGLDFAIGTAPRAIAEGFVPIAARIGASIPVALGPDAFFIPSGGLSGVGVAGSAGAAGIGGVYWGASGVVARGQIGIRTGVTWHRPVYGEESFWLVELGFMRVPMARAAR